MELYEPFLIRAVEPLPMLSQMERVNLLKAKHYNLFSLPASSIIFDWLTDSGNSAQSIDQLSGLLKGDESYCGSRSYEGFEREVKAVFGFNFVVPAHQGRSAEDLFFSALRDKTAKTKVLSNTHFDTTRANAEAFGFEPIDLSVLGKEFEPPFAGDLDLNALDEYLRSPDSIAAIILTITNNHAGGLPVSLKNIEAVRTKTKKHNIPLYFDAARFSENAIFIKRYEAPQLTVSEIILKMMRFSDGLFASAKKDFFGSMGGVITLNDESLFDGIREQMLRREGFFTYGGLSGRDLETLRFGLRESLDETYLNYRIDSIKVLGEAFKDAGFPVFEPFGGHAVFLNALKTAPHLKQEDFPGQSLCALLYEELGVRSAVFGPKGEQFVRLCPPRRATTLSQFQSIGHQSKKVLDRLKNHKGFKILKSSGRFPHFTAQYEMNS